MHSHRGATEAGCARWGQSVDNGRGKLGKVTGEQLVGPGATEWKEMEMKNKDGWFNGGLYCCTIHVCAKRLFSLNIIT